MDIGSTVIKLCTAGERISPVERIPRRPALAPGDQVADLLTRRRPAGHGLRVCSSANGGVRVGILGLSRRHSVAAAARAVADAGGNVVYQRELGCRDGSEAPRVDVLVLAGGVDGADPRRLRTALSSCRLADHPRDVLVWAGTPDPEATAGLPVDRWAGNVLGRHLRPQPDGLARIIRDLYVRDLVDHKGLRALVGVCDAPIWPTPAVVALAAERMSRRGGHAVAVPMSPTTPFVVVDVGGATSDVYLCAELGSAPAAGEGTIVRHVFTDLGVVASKPGLLHRLADHPDLIDLVRAVAPDRPRALFNALSEGDEAALEPPVGFLCCLFLALRRLADGGGARQADLGRAAGFLITGGAWEGAPLAAIHRVVGAARGRPVAAGSILVDEAYQLWAQGLRQVGAGSERH